MGYIDEGEKDALRLLKEKYGYGFSSITNRVQRKRKDGLVPYYAGYDTYSVQNMIEREVGMDENSRADWSADHDRILSWHYHEFRALLKEHIGSGELALGQWSRETTKEKFLAFIEVLKDLMSDDKREIAGARVIHGSNVSSGYPVYTIQWVYKKEQ